MAINLSQKFAKYTSSAPQTLSIDDAMSTPGGPAPTVGALYIPESEDIQNAINQMPHKSNQSAYDMEMADYSASTPIDSSATALTAQPAKPDQPTPLPEGGAAVTISHSPDPNQDALAGGNAIKKPTTSLGKLN